MKTVRKRIVENREKSKKAGDQTDFLLSTPANAARLSESIKQDKLGEVIKKGNDVRPKSSHSLM